MKYFSNIYLVIFHYLIVLSLVFSYFLIVLFVVNSSYCEKMVHNM